MGNRIQSSRRHVHVVLVAGVCVALGCTLNSRGDMAELPADQDASTAAGAGGWTPDAHTDKPVDAHAGSGGDSSVAGFGGDSSVAGSGGKPLDSGAGGTGGVSGSGGSSGAGGLAGTGGVGGSGGSCSGGVCVPGTSYEQPCGSGCTTGTQTMFCDPSCQWTPQGSCKPIQHECQSGDSQQQGCGCTGTGSQSRTCDGIACTWGFWSGCSEPAQCSSGEWFCDAACPGTDMGRPCNGATGCWGGCVQVPTQCGAAGAGGSGGGCGNSGAACNVQSDCCGGTYCQTHNGAPGYLQCQNCVPTAGPCWAPFQCCSGSCSSGQPGACG